MIQGRLVHNRARRPVQRLHQVDLAARRPASDHGDILVDVLTFAPIAAFEGQPQQLDPQPPQPCLVRATQRDLLNAEHPERPRGAR